LDAVIGIAVERAGHRGFRLIKDGRPSPKSPPGSSGLEARVRSFFDKLALKFRQSPKHVENKFSTARRSIDALLKAFKADSTGLEGCNGLDQVFERPPEPIELPNDKTIALANDIEDLGESAPVSGCPTRDVGINFLSPSFRERVFLKIKILIDCRNSSVTDDHFAPPAFFEGKSSQN
jgi:hypothetical protein